MATDTGEPATPERAVDPGRPLGPGLGAGRPVAAERPATSVDVARLAGVSQATVSYVLNDAPGVTISEATRARVRAAADELGYAPERPLLGGGIDGRPEPAAIQSLYV
jgi:hypothetical protein